MSKAPDPPDIPPPPKFSDTYTYDADGRLTGSITRDANGNTIYKAGPLTSEEQINKLAISQKKNALLQRLYQTPEEYTKAAQAEADAWAKNASAALQPAYEKNVNALGNTMNTRGLLGSKAYADTLKDINKSKIEADTSIANTATSMRQGLLTNKLAQDFNLYNIYNQAGNQYDAKSVQAMGAAGNLSNMSNNFNQNAYGQQVNALMNQYNAEMAQYQANEPWRNYVMPALTTGAILLSDRRLKKDIKPEFRVGDVQFYSFEYEAPKDFAGMVPSGRFIGVMADEVKHLPGVVVDGPFGYDMVDYEILRRHLKMEMS